jgi:ketosteroid isomerase-like protein
MKNIKEAIIEANNQFYYGLNEMFVGNLETLTNLWAHSDSITYMGPFGGTLKGWDAISKDFIEVAAMKLGGSISCKHMNVYVGTDMGYINCIEEGENISPDGNLVKVSHRATNIFHLENDKWRLVHHHTDISSQLEIAFDKEIK